MTPPSDPIQALIDAGAIAQSPFDAASRYRDVPIALYAGRADEPPLPYLRRRFIAQRRDIAIAVELAVSGGDRPELMAARTLGDPLLYWRIADANAVTDPFELTDAAGARIGIPSATGL